MQGLSEKSYSLYVKGDGIVRLAKIQTLTIKVGHFYDIAKSKKWEDGSLADVITIGEDGAVCRVGKMDKRKCRPVEWLKGEFAVPFDKFLDANW